ncbi:MAG TPA: hypothetical protein VMB05_17695 [Solirubrobacteraceae bacterium]|nr:hypothetical protein [Solirubrobacteraceae bacterium]HUB72669.1 hypothetical protein [Solirubrobacteraceae bacterium]
MPLDTRTLNSVVRISSAGVFVGTGSIISVPSEANPANGWSYVVTAHHVVAAAGEILIEIEVPDPLAEGRRLFPPVECDDWRQPLPGVDLAIAPLPTERLPRFQSSSFTDFIPEATVVPLGAEIIYLGVFAPPEGRYSARRKSRSDSLATSTKETSSTVDLMGASAARPASRC